MGKHLEAEVAFLESQDPLSWSQRRQTGETERIMDAIAMLGSILGLSFVSGINLYATVAATGLCVKFALIQNLPPEFQVFANDGVILVALFLYFVEFFADKIQGLDTLWDSIHTVIRPLGGAFIALMQIGEASPALEVIVFLVGASVASVAHLTKAGTRLIVNTSPEPFSNIVVSMVEDAGVIGFSYMTLAHPRLSFFITLIFLILMALLLPLLFRTFRMVAGGLFARVKYLFVHPAAKSDLDALSLPLDRYLKDKTGEAEDLLWAEKAYANRIAAIPRFSKVTLVMTSEKLCCLYKRRFRLRLKSLPRMEMNQSRVYPGRIFAKWLIGTPNESWILQVYQPLAGSIPQEMPAVTGRGTEQANRVVPSGV